MTFVQLIDCKTEKYDDMNRLMDRWIDATQGKRTATHSLIGKDRTAVGHYVEIVEFPSYDEALKNSRLPETNQIFEEMAALCDETPTFTDLDVVRDEQLNKAAVRHFLLDLCGRDDPAPFHELFAADYYDHDIANATDGLGPDALQAETLEYRKAFPDFRFTIEDQIAEGDRVVTRWTWRGTHTGGMRGTPPTGRKVETTGTTTFAFAKGRITEGWWHWDYAGMFRQLGAIDPPA
jgi:steroid delta-isomerase-like uncharacterized protein